ncbi:MAG TPA: FAD-dependent oxidoreductase [Clostridia bacterium]|nr:FAD-dependent oxidoreductase [Clostridia bacterium]
MEGTTKIVVIGGVAAGPKAAARARRLLPGADITVIDKGSLISYGSCGLPLLLQGMVAGLDALTSTAYGVKRDVHYFRQEKRINFLVRTLAEEIDPVNREVSLFDLENRKPFKIHFDKLVLATGAQPVVPPIPGVDAEGVVVLHHPEDALVVREKLKLGAKEIVVIGGGLIGIEVAAALAGARRRVVLIEKENQLLPGLLDPEMAAFVTREMEMNQVEVRTGAAVSGIDTGPSGKKEVLLSGERLAADLVILACGVRPNVELAQTAGLAIGSTGALQVNEYLQTSNPDIYAAGDCVENKHLVSDRPVYMPLASTANKQGRVVGSNLAGLKETFPGIMGTGVFQVFELNGGKTGLTEKEARALGYEVITSFTAGVDAAHYHPLHGSGIIKLIACAQTKRLLGAQAVGPGEVVKRLDVLSTAMQLGASLDQMATLDLGYAPPFATPIDLVLHAVNTMRNKGAGLLKGINAAQFKEWLERDPEVLVLDVRTAAEAEDRVLAVGQKMHIPLYELNQRLGEVPKDKKIITFCELGTRAYEAQRLLRGAGFTDVWSLEGGVYALPKDMLVSS